MASIPQRTCIACRTKAAASSFLRIARPSGQELRTLSGPSMGRSAYVCPREACVAGAFSKGRLERALRQTIPADESLRLRRELECNQQLRKPL